MFKFCKFFATKAIRIWKKCFNFSSILKGLNVWTPQFCQILSTYKSWRFISTESIVKYKSDYSQILFVKFCTCSNYLLAKLCVNMAPNFAETVTDKFVYYFIIYLTCIKYEPRKISTFGVRGTAKSLNVFLNLFFHYK